MTGAELKKWRMIAGFKQEELAKELGVSRPTLSAWENRGDEPVDRLVHLAIQALAENPTLRMNYRDGIGPPDGTRHGNS
jgi:transcriptional regulator with XRE-family HTH domain